MGVSVHVRLLAERIPKPAWNRVYAESLRLLHGWPDPPLGIGYREVAGVRVIAHTRKFEREDGWSVVGDAKSRRCAESFELPTGLWVGDTCIGLEASGSVAGKMAMDALDALAEEDAGMPSQLSSLLGSKTQGEPYHGLIVAVATLIENRLPGAALACGDFDIDDADQARDGLASIFGEAFERPVLLEPARIRVRVPNLDAVSLSKRHTSQVAPELTSVLKYLRERLGVRLSADLERKALVCTDVNQLHEGIRMAFTLLGIVLAGSTSRLSPSPTGVDRARIMLQAVAKGTMCQNMRLTDMAWDSIESAGDETREFLYWLCQLNCERLEVHWTFRAIYENPVVRAHVMASRCCAQRNPSGALADVSFRQACVTVVGAQD